MGNAVTASHNLGYSCMNDKLSIILVFIRILSICISDICVYVKRAQKFQTAHTKRFDITLEVLLTAA